MLAITACGSNVCRHHGGSVLTKLARDMGTCKARTTENEGARRRLPSLFFGHVVSSPFAQVYRRV